MSPDAAHDEVKAAFTELALRWHPDRQSDRGGEARERAEWRMREINEAWEVLRNPAARASYDGTLAAGGVAPPARAAARASGGAPPAGSFADHLVDPTRAEFQGPGGAPGRLRRWAPVLVIATLVVIVGGLAIYSAGRSAKPAAPGVQVQTGQYQVGSCVAVLAGPQVLTVPCDQPNSGRISSTTDYPRPCPPETRTVALVSRQISLCLVGR